MTQELLKTKLASLPVPQSDIDHFVRTINNPNNNKNLVAELDNKIVGVVMYDTLENGNGDIGVFVDRDYRGQGIGSMLLKALINSASNTLEVTIFSKNRSRNLYKTCGFVETGIEEKHYFDEKVYLPIQKLILKRSQ